MRLKVGDRVCIQRNTYDRSKTMGTVKKISDDDTVLIKWDTINSEWWYYRDDLIVVNMKQVKAEI